MKSLILILSLFISSKVFAWSYDNEDRRIIINNRSNYIILEIRASNIGRNNFGRDRLGDDTLNPGESGILNLDDNTGYCLFDFRIVTLGAGVIDRHKIDVCQIVEYNIYD